MKTNRIFLGVILAAGLSLAALPSSLAAQSTGTIDFSAQVAPTGGRPEPVRELTFYLLSKSLDDVHAEAMRLEPAPDFDKFVDSLTVSPELKKWMKKRRTPDLAGSDFTKSLTADDIVDIPEFYDAYMSRNAGFKDVGFPKPKYKEKDREANPEKYKKEKEEFTAALRKFITAVPESVQGIDADLTDIDASARWRQLQGMYRTRLKNRIVELAEQRYLAGKTDSDLNGHGSFAGIAPGAYWISMVGIQAISGDVRLSWDLPVTVRPGETTRVELTNLNAATSNDTAKNMDY